jgi:hypothetical protein
MAVREQPVMFAEIEIGIENVLQQVSANWTN